MICTDEKSHIPLDSCVYIRLQCGLTCNIIQSFTLTPPHSDYGNCNIKPLVMIIICFLGKQGPLKNTSVVSGQDCVDKRGYTTGRISLRNDSI